MSGGRVGRDTKQATAGSQRAAADDVEPEDRFGAVERSRAILRAEHPDLDVERHAELDAQRVPSGAAAAAERIGLGDVSQVRIHTGEESASMAGAVGARAFAVGDDIHFGAGQYRPGTPDGDALLGHELAHTAQQKGTDGAVQAKREEPSSASAEQEADDAGAAMTSTIHDGADMRIGPVSQVAAPYVARDDGDPSGNAYLVVKGFTKSGHVVTWKGEFSYDGSLPRTFRGEASGRGWVWNDPDAATIRVNTASMRRRSDDGQPIEQWAAKNKVVRVTAFLYEKRVEVVDEEATDVGGQTGGGEATALPSDEKERDTADREDPDTAEAGGAGRDPTVEGSGTDGGASDTPALDPDSEIDRALAEFEAELGILDAEEGGETGGDTGDRDGNGDEEREGRDDGKGSPVFEGYSGGDLRDPRAQLGEKSEWNTREVFGGEDGMETGDGPPDHAGARHAVALFGGLLNVPLAIRPVVELGLIISEGNVFGDGFGAFKKALKFFTDKGVKKAQSAAIRSALAKQSRHNAAKRFKEVRANLDKSDDWLKLTEEQRKQAERVMYWRFQREFFDGVEAAAKDTAKKLKAKLKRSKKLKGKAGRAQREALQRELDAAEALGEAAGVKPVAGRLPANHRYAGKEFPRESLPREFQEKGLRFTDEGYPDFMPYAKELPNGKKSVKIELTGSRAADEAAANAAAGYKKTPLYHTWHHSEKVGEMILVPTKLHDAVRHTGGAAHWTHDTGVLYVK